MKNYAETRNAGGQCKVFADRLFKLASTLELAGIHVLASDVDRHACRATIVVYEECREGCQTGFWMAVLARRSKDLGLCIELYKLLPDGGNAIYITPCEVNGPQA